MSIGSYSIPLRDVVPALLGSGDPAAVLVVHDLRLPRALVAVLTGSALGMAGAILQALARNPLASPDVLGITAGASAAAVFVITVVGATSAYTLPLAAFAGALGTALVLYALAYRQGVSAYRLILVGIGLGATLQAVTSYFLTRTYVTSAAAATTWLVGSLNARLWPTFWPLAISMAALVPLAFVAVRPLRALQLGDATAAGLGVRVERARLALLVVAVLLAAVATASAGPVAFVAFVSAPIARRLLGTGGVALLPAALVGSLLVLSADLAGQQLVDGGELPAGVLTGVIGGAYLLYLVARVNRIGRAG